MYFLSGIADILIIFILYEESIVDEGGESRKLCAGIFSGNYWFVDTQTATPSLRLWLETQQNINTKLRTLLSPAWELCFPGRYVVLYKYKWKQN